MFDLESVSINTSPLYVQQSAILLVRLSCLVEFAMLDKIFVDVDCVVAAQFASFTDHCVSHVVSVELYNDHNTSISYRCLSAKQVTSHNITGCDPAGGSLPSCCLL